MTEANTVTTTDSLGRNIILRKLNALDRLRLFEMLGSELSENVLYLSYAMSAACVTKIDNVEQAFPRSKKTVENLVSTLGDEGLEAVAKAYKENFTIGETGDLETIKN